MNWFVNVFDFQMVKKKVIIVIMIIMMTPTSEKNNELCGVHDDINISMLVTLFV